MSSLLFGVAPVAVVAFAPTSVLVSAALAASYVPAGALPPSIPYRL